MPTVNAISGSILLFALFVAMSSLNKKRPVMLIKLKFLECFISTVYMCCYILSKYDSACVGLSIHKGELHANTNMSSGFKPDYLLMKVAVLCDESACYSLISTISSSPLSDVPQMRRQGSTVSVRFATVESCGCTGLNSIENRSCLRSC